MSNENQPFLAALLSISSKPIDKQWDLFVQIIQQFKPLNNNFFNSIENFNDLHNELIPRSKNTGRFRQESTGNHRNVEALFPPVIFRFFRWFPTGSCQKAQEIDRNPPEKIQQISVGNTASTSGYFGAFLQDPVTFSLLSCRIRRDPAAVIFDLGKYDVSR